MPTERPVHFGEVIATRDRHGWIDPRQAQTAATGGPPAVSARSCSLGDAGVDLGANRRFLRRLSPRPSQGRISTRGIFKLYSKIPIGVLVCPNGQLEFSPALMRGWVFSGAGLGVPTIPAPRPPCRYADASQCGSVFEETRRLWHSTDVRLWRV